MERVLEILAQSNAEAVTLDKRQVEAKNAMAPLAADPIRSTQLMQETAVATMFPFVEPAVADPEGVMYGFDQTGTPVLVDRFLLSGFCKVVGAKIGVGKTDADKMEQFRRMAIDPEIELFAIDPQADFVTDLGGEVIRFGGDTVIYPLAISPSDDYAVADPLTKKLRSVMGMFRTHFEGVADWRKKRRASYGGLSGWCI